MIGKDEIMIKVMKKIHQENNQRFMNRRTAKSFWRMQFESVPENCFVSMFLTGGTADPLLLTKRFFSIISIKILFKNKN